MSFGDLFAVAVAALRRLKLRSFLTLLGVIIGVMTVVSVVSIISGLNANVRDKVLNLNPDVIVFTKYGIIRSRSEFLIARKRKAITMRDAQVIEVEGLVKAYQNLTAVDGLTFGVARGEVLGLVGPNGAGKTTTLRCLAGIPIGADRL